MAALRLAEAWILRIEGTERRSPGRDWRGRAGVTGPGQRAAPAIIAELASDAAGESDEPGRWSFGVAGRDGRFSSMRILPTKTSTGESVTRRSRGAGRASPVVWRRPRGEGGDLEESVGRAVRRLSKTPRRHGSRLPRSARPAATSQRPGRGFPAI